MLTHEIEARKRMHDHVTEESDWCRSAEQAVRTRDRTYVLNRAVQCKVCCLVMWRMPLSGRRDFCACAHLRLRKDKLLLCYIQYKPKILLFSVAPIPTNITDITMTMVPIIMYGQRLCW